MTTACEFPAFSEVSEYTVARESGSSTVFSDVRFFRVANTLAEELFALD